MLFLMSFHYYCVLVALTAGVRSIKGVDSNTQYGPAKDIKIETEDVTGLVSRT